MSHLEILLVDDDPLIRHVIADELEEAGHFVTPAVGPEAAIELLHDNDAFDLILIDYTMPGMTGGDLARHILGIMPNARVAILTGMTDLPDPPPCPVLTKGMRMSELIKAIEAVAAGDRVSVAHDASASRVDLMVDQMATKPAVGGVRSGIASTYEAPEPAEGLPDAFASVLGRLDDK
ncbi:Response regulator receiver protein [Beijerinckiaceae bacterium RH AL1]|nr:response regulator [Beijerinckiaceae bacterium]VVB47420.1 Response regulator receiver protein [Beijerinckiaceae bacterium RH CH11]VVB47502.1 Response regulator receiver protein [Beijerinckiaceae bacterium RH AL8]VVC55880.1 Response regulator receiver protein [Beijerinckiaceae bacterium RH AL1]